MTKHLDAMKAQMQVMMADAEREGKDWRRRLTLSLTVGNGAGLLSFFGQAKDLMGPGSPEPLLMVSPWLFLLGLVAASIAPYVWAKERGNFAIVMFTGPAVLESDEDVNEDELKIKFEYIRQYDDSRRALRWQSGLAVGFEVVSALAFVGGVSISLILIGGVL